MGALLGVLLKKLGVILKDVLIVVLLAAFADTAVNGGP